MLHVLIGAGFAGIILFYSFTDGIRFLRSNFDKFLYMICCLLQKPLLFPVMFPSRFRSRIAEKHIKTHTVTFRRIEVIEGKQKEVTVKILPTNFLLAVQETNFLYSFTLSGFVAISTVCTLLIHFEFSGPEAYGNTLMLVISGVYAIYGMIISVFMYGRKTDHLTEYWKEREESESDNDN